MALMQNIQLLPLDFKMLYSVLLIWGLAAVTPGPNFFITIHTAIGTTRRLSFYTVLGIVAGTLVWSVSGYMGISILFKTAPALYIFLKITGGLYLMVVGLNLIFKRKDPVQCDNGTKPHSAMSCFRLGLLTNLLNPKTAFFMTGLFAATVSPDPAPQNGAACVLLICAVSAGWYSFVAAVFSYDKAKKAFEAHKRKIERAAGAIFVGYGIKLAISR